MAFGMKPPAAAADFADIIKYDANAGRLFRVDYCMDTREKTAVDITVPPPRFAMDFGSLEVGYAHFAATGPDFRLVPEGQQLPLQPMELDDKRRLKFRPAFRMKCFGKVLDGLREWSSAADSVLQAVEDTYAKFRAASEAQQGKIPIVELTKTLPITFGRGQRQRTLYVPVFTITGWTDRVPAMGERTVPPPMPQSGAAAAPDIDDEIPF